MTKWLNEEALDVLQHYYYPKAYWLQDNCNWGKLSYTGEEANKIVNDPLMQFIEIYDCYSRDAAGFSNVLQDLRFKEKTPKWHHQSEQRHNLIKTYITEGWDLKTWLFAMLSHRVFGSGASFQNDHGYRNNCVQYWGALRDWQDMREDAKSRKARGEALFTSIGNQPPAPKKGVSNVDFIYNELPGLIDRLIEWLFVKKRTCKEVVDFLNSYNTEVGHRKFNFVYAAFSYDLADYHKDLVDEYSHGYFGNNAIRCMQTMSRGYSSDEFMDILVEKTGGQPKSLEDVLCDFIRFGQQYDPWQRGLYFNGCSIDFIKKYNWTDRSGKNKNSLNITEMLL